MDNPLSPFTDESMILYGEMYACTVNMLLVWAELFAHKCASFNFPIEKHGFTRKVDGLKEGKVSVTSLVEQVLFCQNVC